MRTHGAQPFPAGTFVGGTQTIGSINRNQWAESCHTFSYANTNFRAAGTYTGRVTYTLSVAMTAVLKGTLVLMTALAVADVTPACAATYLVDDGASAPQESTALLRWRQAAPSRSNDNSLEGAMAVVVRLNLAPWINHSGRVFLALPEQGTTRSRCRGPRSAVFCPGGSYARQSHTGLCGTHYDPDSRRNSDATDRGRWQSPCPVRSGSSFTSRSTWTDISG